MWRMVGKFRGICKFVSPYTNGNAEYFLYKAREFRETRNPFLEKLWEMYR